MSEFRQGWYEVQFNAGTRQRTCLHFNSPQTYTAKCLIDSNGVTRIQWADVDGPDGQGKAALWAKTFKSLDDKMQPEWWLATGGAIGEQPKLPDSHSRTERAPTPQELCFRIGHGTASREPDCSKEIHVGIFFDGTNNNRDRDRPSLAHSNVVSLWDAHKEDRERYFSFYVPGVGTPFPDIGELTESSHGKAFAKGGEARIHWALIQVYNAVAMASTTPAIVKPEEALQLCTNKASGLATFWRLNDDKMISIFEDINTRLKRAIEGKRPRVTKVHLSVFGFSRGAAGARVFCNWLQRASQMRVGDAHIEIKFLGLFDTVASVGFADASPVGRGLMDWADGNIDIAGVNKVVHYVAATEIRKSFPLSTARTGRNYPPGVEEFAYPGAHSDLGGSYSPGDQGKAHGAQRSGVLSQIPLNDMYYAAINAGVALFKPTEMPRDVLADFRIDPELDKAFQSYIQWTEGVEEEESIRGGRGALEGAMAQHTHNYWLWRFKVSSLGLFEALSSVKNAKPQDRTDLTDAERDWLHDVQAARAQAAKVRAMATGPDGLGGGSQSFATPLQKKLLEVIESGRQIPKDVSDFFDRYVHDSQASFYMLGPVTKWERGEMIKAVKKKKAYYDALVKKHAEERYADPAMQLHMESVIEANRLNSFELRVLDAAPVFELREKKAEFERLQATNAKRQSQGGNLTAEDQRKLDASRLSPPEEAQLTKMNAEGRDSFPVVTDKDTSDLRDHYGAVTSFVVKTLVGSKTRREPTGHARYRAILDKA